MTLKTNGRSTSKETFGFEVEKLGITKKGIISGIASKFNSPILHGGMVNIISPQAFDRSLATGSKIPLLNQHNMLDPVGVITEIAPKDGALQFKAQLALKNSRAADVFALAEAGVLSGVSIGFVPSVTRYGKDKMGRRVRYIDDVELHEISLVTVPADKNAQVMVAYAEDFDAESVEMETDEVVEPIGSFDAKGAFALLEERILKLEESSKFNDCVSEKIKYLVNKEGMDPKDDATIAKAIGHCKAKGQYSAEANEEVITTSDANTTEIEKEATKVVPYQRELIQLMYESLPSDLK